MKNGLVFLLLFAISSSVNAQMTLYDPVTSRTFNADKYSSIKGSPFLFEKWIRGSATSARGIYKDLELKLDSYSNTLFFNREDEPYEFLEPIKSFVLVGADSMFFKNGLTGPSLKPDQYVQVLAEGKVGFYRSDIKTISEMSEINVGMVKTFNNSTRYYIVKDGQTKLARLNKSDILEYIKDKEDAVKEYIDKNKNATKKEADFVRILNYYNSL